MIPDTQYGFFPGRSTLRPLFILRHIKYAAQRMQSGSSQLYAAFIDSNKLMIVFQDISFEVIYAAAGCPTISYPS